MLPIKFWLNPTKGLGDAIWRISRWPSWISEPNNFSNSESLCRSDAFHEFSAQSDLWLRRICRLKNFKMAATLPSLISERNDFSNSESLCHGDASYQLSAQSNLRFGRRCRFRISRRPPWRPSWISERNDFSNSVSLCHCDASYQVSAQSDLRFGRRYGLKNFGYRNGTILAILNLHFATMPPIKFKLNPTYGSWGDVENVKKLTTAGRTTDNRPCELIKHTACKHKRWCTFVRLRLVICCTGNSRRNKP